MVDPSHGGDRPDIRPKVQREYVVISVNRFLDLDQSMER
jgi:hypothetical protein